MVIHIKLLILLCIYVLLSACGGFRAPGYVEPEFEKYVAVFETMYDINVDVNVKFSKLSWPTVAMCSRAFHMNSSDSVIEVDRDFWATASEHSKQFTIHHELGHCVFGLSHNDAIGKVGNYYNVPLSIMNKINFGYSSVFKDNEDYYYGELFSEYVNR